MLVTTAAANTYTVQRGDTLTTIAAKTGASIRGLVDANAISNPDRIFVGQVLAIPGSSAAPPGSGGGATTHTVRRGETLSSIALRHGVSVADLAALNGIANPNLVMAGATLNIPGAIAGGSEAPSGTPVDQLLRSSGAPASHVVARGENLSGIAARYGVSLAALVEANGIGNPNLVRIGQVLTIPVGGSGGFICPVQGSHRFVNDFGWIGHRFHEGIDLFAARGTPVVASVAGEVEQIHGVRGGLQYWLYGDDGNLYVGTHLDAFGAGGRVEAGTVVGYVGNTGNAWNTSPHLHFEILVGGEELVNPYQVLLGACRG